MPTDAATRAKGDHLLVDEWAIGRIVAAANLRPGESVMDLGAGEGALTVPLARAVGKGGRIVAVELDAERCWTLRKLGLEGLEVVEGDILKVDLPAVDAVVANPPFKVAPPLLKRVLAAGCKRAVLVLPTELADRLSAPLGSEGYGKLTVEVGLLAKVEVLFLISKRAFDPPPDVGSTVVRLVPRAPPPGDLRLMDAVLDAAWENKAQTLRHALAGLDDRLGIPPQAITEALALVNGGGRRAQQLTPWEYATIAAHLARLGGATKAERKRSNPPPAT